MDQLGRVALITGVSGQDGAYLAQLLLKKGYQVYGASRDAQMNPFQNLVRLGIQDQVKLESISLNDFRSVLQVLTKVAPDEIYNLAGQSSVALSFQQPMETSESLYLGTLNLLEAIRFTGRPIRLYNAASSECFGDLRDGAANEETPFRPRSPYGVAKAAAFWQLSNYREAYGIFACSGILFNHESPLRPERFVTQKITAAAVRIAAGKQDKLVLGNIEIERDWGWAPEYVEAMHAMLQYEIPEDFVIATGESRRLADFVEIAFDHLGLDWREKVETDASFFRPTELMYGRGDPSKAARLLGWIPKRRMAEVARLMVDAQRAKMNG